VVDIDRAADRGGVGEDVGGIAQQDLFAEAGGDFVAVHRCVASWQIDHRFRADGAAIAEWGVEPVQQNGADVFDPGDGRGRG
jgi:hypothetical protein